MVRQIGRHDSVFWHIVEAWEWLGRRRCERQLLRVYGEVLHATGCVYWIWGQGFLECLGIMTAYVGTCVDAAIHVAVVDAERRRLRLMVCGRVY